MEKDGILLVDKPEGLSSARVVSIVKRRLKVKKVGHTGTLDPFATGLLPIAVGKGTKLSRFYLGGNKAYQATLRLGIQTDTYDKTGETVAKADEGVMAGLTEDRVKEAVAGFLGPQEQVPPVYSALKHKGVPLYRLARQGKAVTKPPRSIEILDIRVTRMELPQVEIFVSCSGGTYIRSIAHDLGEQLGCGAHLSALRRTGSSQFRVEDALTMDTLEKMESEELVPHILPPSQCIPFLPKLEVGEEILARIRHGQPLTKKDIGDVTDPGADTIRITTADDQLLALVSPDKNGLTYNYCCVFVG